MRDVWRVGTKLGRTLYKNGEFVGTVDTKEIAEEIVRKMNDRITIDQAVVVFNEAIKGAGDLMKTVIGDGVKFVKFDWSTQRYDANGRPIEIEGELIAHHQDNKTTSANLFLRGDAKLMIIIAEKMKRWMFE
jgi:hypothetical protein